MFSFNHSVILFSLAKCCEWFKMFYLQIIANRSRCNLDISAPIWVLNTPKVWGRDVCASPLPFSAGGEKVWLYLRAPFPPSALWITVIVSFVALSRMTDYDQQDEWGQLIVEATRLARLAFSCPPHAGACTCSLPGMTACMLHGAPAMRPGRSSHTQVAGFPVPTHNWIPDILADVWDRAATVSTQERRTSPRSHWKAEWGSQLFGPHLLQTGKYAKIWFAENPGIVLITAVFFFSLVLAETLEDFILGDFYSSHEQLFIFRRRPRVNLQCHQPVTVIYVMFSLTPDFYLNDSPTEQLTTCNNFLISQNNLNRVR